MAEQKVKELTIEDLQKQIQETEERYQQALQRVTVIANKYIKAYRDLLYQLKSTVETNFTLDELMSPQQKEQ
jgi:DNA/RNA-binding domain of Phe-tRNA-synthetase-like protein